jgi:hypothetical protein
MGSAITLKCGPSDRGVRGISGESGNLVIPRFMLLSIHALPPVGEIGELDLYYYAYAHARTRRRYRTSSDSPNSPMMVKVLLFQLVTKGSY